jgi:four helix bundle protein
MAIRSYKDLDVWKLSVAFVTKIYACTKEFPREELYGITSQIRRAAVSIPSNIAEGNAKRSTRDYIRFLNIVRGSLAELDTQLIIAHNLGYLSDAKAKQLAEDIDHISRKVFTMRKRLDDYVLKTGGLKTNSATGHSEALPASLIPDQDLPENIFEE